MTQRKGQHLFNEISKRFNLSHFQGIECDDQGNITGDTPTLIPYANLHQILFFITDEEFDGMMESLNKKLMTCGKCGKEKVYMCDQNDSKICTECCDCIGVMS